MYILDSGLNYMSYILIIIYLSALAILFAFVIMFFTNLTTFNKSSSNSSRPYTGVFYYFFPILAFILYLFFFTNTNTNNFLPMVCNNEGMIVTDLIKKIGVILYNNDMVIFNLFGVTFILFVALIGILLLFVRP